MRKKIMNIRKSTNLKMVRNFTIFILLIIVTFWWIFRKQNMNDLFNTIKSANIIYLVLGAFLMLCYHLTESYNLRSILVTLGERKISIFKALKFTFIGFFFSSITPAASGGQPIEIYYMTKEDIPGPKATLTSLLILFGFQMSTITYGVVCAIINPKVISGGLFWLFLLGTTLNVLALTLFFFCIFSPKTTRKIIKVFIKGLKKARIKNMDKREKQITDSLNKYNEGAAFIKSNKSAFIKIILREFLQVAFYFSVPFCIYKSLGLNTYNYFEIFSMQAILYITVCALPLPGAVGVSETVFLRIFEAAFGTTLIAGSMILSRGVTFYLYVLISFFVVLINAIRMRNVKGDIDNYVTEFEKDLEK